MNKSKKISRLVVIIILAVISVMLFLFIFSKEFRLNFAVRIIALGNIDITNELIWSVHVEDDYICIEKIIFPSKANSQDVHMDDLSDYEPFKKSLRSSIKLNDKIYALQRSDFWCNKKRAVYIFSDTCVDQGPTAISVGTGQASFMRFYDTEDSVEGKWADIEYLSVNAKNECRDIVAQNDGYVFR